MNLYEFETTGISDCEGKNIISVSVVAETEIEARETLDETFKSEKCFDIFSAKCVETYLLDKPQIIHYKYDM